MSAALSGDYARGDAQGLELTRLMPCLNEAVRVVNAPQPGYGAAPIAGIEAARACHVIMGDGDDRNGIKPGAMRVLEFFLSVLDLPNRGERRDRLALVQTDRDLVR